LIVRQVGHIPGKFATTGAQVSRVVGVPTIQGALSNALIRRAPTIGIAASVGVASLPGQDFINDPIGSLVLMPRRNLLWFA
jgi:hypothetical protein